MSALLCTLCLYVGQWSYHFDREQHWNEDNRLIGIEYSQLFALSFANSYGDDSQAVGKRFDLWRSDQRDFSAGIKVGVIHGYKDHLQWWHGGAVAPFALPEVSWAVTRRIAININVLPGEFVSAGVKFNLD